MNLPHLVVPRPTHGQTVMTAWGWGYEVGPGPGHWTWAEYGYWPNVATGPGVAAWPNVPCGHTQTMPRSWRPYANVATWPPSKRPVTEFAKVLAAIDENHQGDHVHVTDAKQLSINCFPTGFAQVMAGSFGIHCSIRKSVLFLDVLLDPLSTRGSTWRRYARALQR